MAEELYFIKTNPTIAKINLYNKLTREEEKVIPFLQEDSKVSLEIIKNKVKDSVEELSREELSSIFTWFSNTYPTDSEEVKTQLFINGLDIFYEIPKEQNIQSFKDILSDYEKYAQQHLDFMVNAQNFNQFLVYGLFFTDIALEEKGSCTVLSHYLKADHASLYDLAEEHFRNKGSDRNIAFELQHYFGELYDLTKFYKGSIIQLYS
ncbi:hypothetical protein ACM46_07180 [Chryseobacterium angstadtii]|uniref:Uncharacterized protein n=1 Tax=Chryseobacterium angstadtii TaxID=558151 RepID=A0A0J7II31_9FLAO|nr:hypothetical protein [Chryseobacterium angstadtii]KMQ65649.1 hypothetical protein ACM46_07180 [Chryseobacterium angstadtii]